jgi:hypothetical protein
MWGGLEGVKSRLEGGERPSEVTRWRLLAEWGGNQGWKEGDDGFNVSGSLSRTHRYKDATARERYRRRNKSPLAHRGIAWQTTGTTSDLRAKAEVLNSTTSRGEATHGVHVDLGVEVTGVLLLHLLVLPLLGNISGDGGLCDESAQSSGGW